jgi:hypothetical protein
MLCNGDPEYGEYAIGGGGRGGSPYGSMGGMPSTPQIAVYGAGYVYPVPRPQLNIDRGTYQKRVAQYYDVKQNYATLQPLDSSKFYMTHGERSNHFTPELVFYMNVLHAQVIGKIYKNGGRMEICSGFRSIEHNSNTSGAATWSAHSGGMACDIYLPDSYEQRIFVLDKAFMLGFGGLGLYDTFVHIDVSGRAMWGGYKGPRGV